MTISVGVADSSAVGSSHTAEEWARRLDVEALIVDYLLALDEKRFTDAAACFTEDGVLQFDTVSIVGPGDIGAAMQRQLGVLELTHHTLCNSRVSLLSDTEAVFASQAIGTHRWSEDGQPKQSLLGGSYRAELSRTDAGWRLTLLAPSFLWTVGDSWQH